MVEWLGWLIRLQFADLPSFWRFFLFFGRFECQIGLWPLSNVHGKLTI